MLDRLEDLGLTSYEARALSFLLSHGECGASILSREADIPFGRVYDTLNHLASRGLVTIRPGRPKLYAAAHPGSIASRLHAWNRRRLQEEEQAVGQKVSELEQQLQALDPKNAPMSSLHGVRLGEDASREFLIEATHAAETDIAAYLTFDHIQDDDLALFHAFRKAVGRGVRTRILLREADVNYLVRTPYVDDVLDAMLPHLGETLQVRLTPTDSVPFSILDGMRVMMGVKNPLDPRFYFAVVHLDDRAFSKDLHGKFETLWREGTFDMAKIQGLLESRMGRKIAKLGSRVRRRSGS